jgi:hypothetical protein
MTKAASAPDNLSHHDRDGGLVRHAVGVGDLEWRRRLSRASDELLIRTARHIPGAILVSFWATQEFAWHVERVESAID